MEIHRDYQIDDDRTRLQFGRIHAWLASTYWSPNVAREKVEKAAEGSALVVAAYAADGTQVGYLRVVSDTATFAWVCDVFVDEAHRGKGIARAMVGFALAHPEFQGLRRWLLATKDAHGVYGALGFVPLTNPERWLALIPASAPSTGPGC